MCSGGNQLFEIEKVSVFGSPMTREQVMEELYRQPQLYQVFLRLTEQMKEEFLEFCMGVRGLRVTYDPVFKKIFNPEIHPERLEEFLSLCLKEKLKILRMVPNESQRLMEEGSLLVMDILVQLESGALVNVEIQRIGYLFPGARCACYSSDLVMRQYSQVREQMRKEKQAFSYKDIRKVYTIVLIQDSTKEFHQLPDQYLHYAKQTFNTGLSLDMIQEYLMIPLDIFRGIKENISNRLDAWLYFIGSDRPEDIWKVIEAYPDFRKLYEEVFRFRFQMKELIGMFSEALRILDANTVQYMIELQKKELEENRVRLADQSAKLVEQNAKLVEQNAKLVEQNAKLVEQSEKLVEQDAKLAEQEKEIARLKKLLEQRQG